MQRCNRQAQQTLRWVTLSPHPVHGKYIHEEAYWHETNGEINDIGYSGTRRNGAHCCTHRRTNGKSLFSLLACLVRYWYFGEKILTDYCFLYVVLVPGASNEPCDNDYRGTKPFSEVEVKNVAEYLRKNRPAGYMDIHAYSQLWMTPWGYTRSKTRDYKELVRQSLNRQLEPLFWSLKRYITNLEI